MFFEILVENFFNDYLFKKTFFIKSKIVCFILRNKEGYLFLM